MAEKQLFLRLWQNWLALDVFEERAVSSIPGRLPLLGLKWTSERMNKMLILTEFENISFKLKKTHIEHFTNSLSFFGFGFEGITDGRGHLGAALHHRNPHYSAVFWKRWVRQCQQIGYFSPRFCHFQKCNLSLSKCAREQRSPKWKVFVPFSSEESTFRIFRCISCIFPKWFRQNKGCPLSIHRRRKGKWKTHRIDEIIVCFIEFYYFFV